MEKIRYILLCFFAICLSSCSVYEDIYLKENGQVSYQMKFDASQMMAMMPDMMNRSGKKIPNDTLISFKDIIKEKVDVSTLSEEDKKDMENISNLFLKMESSVEKNQLTVAVFGDFENADAFNKTFESLDRQQLKGKALPIGDYPMGGGSKMVNSLFLWDGKTLSRKLNKSNENTESEDSTPMSKELSQLFSQGKMIVTYHFPKAVESISNSNAVLSQDRKTVIIEYSGNKYLNPDNSTDIEIKVKK